MVISNHLQKILSLLAQGYKTYGIATSILLTWLMRADGKTSSSEIKVLDDYLKQFQLIQEKQLFIRIVDEFDSHCIQFASEILQRELTDEGKRLTMDLFLGMIIADGYITYTEVYCIEFIADLFGYTPEHLNEIFIEATGRPKVKPGNPSSKSWWEKRENEKKEQRKNHRQSSGFNSSITGRQKALAILGLDENATDKEIKSAFRLLTKVHHPDRFQKLGNEAKRSANQTFIRIKDAYEYLVAS